MENYTQVVERIVKLREQSGLTQEAVAKSLGLSRQRYMLVEKGERDLSIEELEILAGVFGVSIVDFFNEPRNNKKFLQMYFYILKYAGKNGKIPKTKLAKLLYLADFRNFFDELEPMSGVRYIRREYGPVADIFFEVTEDLYDTGKINIEPYNEALMIKSTTSDIGEDLLSASEKKRIREICALWKDKRTSEIVNFTHQQKPWLACKDGEYIPYTLIVQEDPEHVYQPIA
jgi:transcriptional regulator with XRE-family HTH domain